MAIPGLDRSPGGQELDDAESSICEPAEVQLHACAMLICQQQRYIDCLERTLREADEGLTAHTPLFAPSPAVPLSRNHSIQSYSAMKEAMNLAHSDPALADASSVAYNSFVKLSTLKKDRGSDSGDAPPAAAPAGMRLDMSVRSEEVAGLGDAAESVAYSSRRNSAADLGGRRASLQSADEAQPAAAPPGGRVADEGHAASMRLLRAAPRVPKEAHVAPCGLQPASTFVASSVKPTPMAVPASLEQRSPTEASLSAAPAGPALDLSSSPAALPADPEPQPDVSALPPPFSTSKYGPGGHTLQVGGSHRPAHNLICYIRHPPAVPGGQYLYKGCVMALGQVERVQQEGVHAEAAVRVDSVEAAELTLKYSDQETAERIALKDIESFAAYHDPRSQVLSLGLSFAVQTRSSNDPWIGFAQEAGTLEAWLDWARHQAHIDTTSRKASE